MMYLNKHSYGTVRDEGGASRGPPQQAMFNQGYVCTASDTMLPLDEKSISQQREDYLISTCFRGNRRLGTRQHQEGWPNASFPRKASGKKIKILL